MRTKASIIYIFLFVPIFLSLFLYVKPVFAQQEVGGCELGSCDSKCPNFYVPSLSNEVYKKWCDTPRVQGGGGGHFYADGCVCKAPIYDDISLNVAIPGLGNNDGTNSFKGGLAAYIYAIYKFFIGASVIVSLVMMMIGGFQWTLAGGIAGKVASAQERIKNAVAGLLLALFSYSILFFINPDLLRLQFTELYSFPPLVGADENKSCGDFLGPPYNSKNLKDIATSKGWNCGTKGPTVAEFNSAGVVDANGNPIFIQGEQVDIACQGYLCSNSEQGCAGLGTTTRQCKNITELVVECLKTSNQVGGNVVLNQESSDNDTCKQKSFKSANKQFKCVLAIHSASSGDDDCVAISYGSDFALFPQETLSNGCFDEFDRKLFFYTGFSTSTAGLSKKEKYEEGKLNYFIKNTTQANNDKYLSAKIVGNRFVPEEPYIFQEVGQLCRSAGKCDMKKGEFKDGVQFNYCGDI